MAVWLLIINPRTVDKLARHGISAEEARDLLRHRYALTLNPRPRVPGSQLMIGSTAGGRMLTLVVQPDLSDESMWHVMTGWEATPRELAAFRRST